MKRTMVMGLVLAAASGIALAGPLDKTVVAKGAQWVVHIDVEAAVGSKVGQFVLAHRAELDLGDMDHLKQELGIDPVKEIKGITVYGNGPDENDGVAVIYATAALDGFIEKIRQKEKGIELVTLGAYKVYSWSEDGATKYAQVRESGQDRIVVAASDKDRLLAGISVLEGRSENAAKDGALAEFKARPGSFVCAVASKLPHAEATPLKLSEEFVLDAGEDGKDFYADVGITAKSTEQASNFAQTAIGLVAFAKIGLANNPEYKDVLDLLDGVSIRSDGARVLGTFRYPCDRIVSAMQDVNAKKHSAPAKKGGGRKTDERHEDR